MGPSHPDTNLIYLYRSSRQVQCNALPRAPPAKRYVRPTMLRRVAPRVSAFAAQRARGMCDMTEGVTVDMVCRVFSCKARSCQRCHCLPNDR
jgi:hypothetical protein